MSRQIRSWIQRSVLGSTWKHVQDRTQNPATCSQERLTKDNPCQRSRWKPGAKWCAWTVQEAAGNSSRILKINMKGHGWTSTICKSPTSCTLKRKSWRHHVDRELRLSFNTLDDEDQRIALVTIYVNNDEVVSLCRPPIPRELGCMQEHRLRGAQDVVRHHAKIDRGTIIRDFEYIYDDTEFHTFDEIYFVSWSSYQVGESKGTRLLRFFFCLGKMYDHSEANEKWKRQIK